MASPTALQRLLKPPLQALAKTRFGGWFAVTVANPIDRRLLRWTGGRIGLFLGQPVGLLEVRGARSGALRETRCSTRRTATASCWLLPTPAASSTRRGSTT